MRRFAALLAALLWLAPAHAETISLSPSGGGGSSSTTIGTTPITGGADKQVLFNDGGVFGSDAGFTYDKTTKSVTLTGGTITANSPILDISRTWNNAGITFTGIKYNVTDTASATPSLLMDFQTGGASKASISKTGNLTLAGSLFANGGVNIGSGNFTNMVSTTTGILLLRNATGASWDRIQLGGTTTSFPGVFRNATGVDIKLADGSAFAPLSAELVTVATGTATPAGGSTAARLLMGTTAGFGMYYGSGAPSVTAAKGSLYLRSDGSGVTDRAYINTDGGTTWTAIATAG